jgi:hypothetical protein
MSWDMASRFFDDFSTMSFAVNMGTGDWIVAIFLGVSKLHKQHILAGENKQG